MTKQIDVEDKNVFFPERLDTCAQLHELISHRRSPRAFSEQPIEPWKILSLFEAARWSPSSMNEQPWHFIAATKDDAETYTALFESLSEGNRRWADRAPLLVLGIAQSTYSRTGKPYRHSWYDLGQSVAHLTLQAGALGLAVHQIGGFDADRTRQVLTIPDGYDPVVMIAAGYPGDPETLPHDLREREQAPRSRKPLERMVFTGMWGKPSHHVQTQKSLLDNPPSRN